MSEDFQTTAPAVRQSPADSATERAIEAVVTNAPPTQKEAAFDRASILHRRSAAPEQEGTPGHGGWRDGSAATSLGPMPEAPHIETSEVNVAINKLNSRGDEHASLVKEWGADFGANLAYAKAEFKKVAATNPDLISKFEASGLGDDVSVLQFLAKHGRMSAGMMGDFTTARNNEPMSINRTGPTATPGSSGNNRGSEETRTELARLMNENPPGSQRYKDPQVQARIQQLSRTIAGSGAPVGVGGRRA
jgi:hypothetical protein